MLELFQRKRTQVNQSRARRWENWRKKWINWRTKTQFRKLAITPLPALQNFLWDVTSPKLAKPPKHCEKVIFRVILLKKANVVACFLSTFGISLTQSNRLRLPVERPYLSSDGCLLPALSSRITFCCLLERKNNAKQPVFLCFLEKKRWYSIDFGVVSANFVFEI